jgi:allophanate hydrolase subunit 2
LAQARPGEALRFAAVDRGQAAAANRKYRGQIARLHWAVDLALAREASPPSR